MEELPDQWKEFSCTSSKEGDKTESNNCCGISLVSISYKILSNLLVSRFFPHIYDIIIYYVCGFLHNRPTTDQHFCIRQIQEKKWEYKGRVQTVPDFKKAYDSVRKDAQ
jgi:hypothetical protein